MQSRFLQQKAHPPGVGAFGDAMEHLRETGLDEVVQQYAASGKPLLGICLGMQLLFTSSEEHGDHEGLGLLPGPVVRFRGDYKVPHMGWNRLSFKQSESPLFSKALRKGTYTSSTPIMRSRSAKAICWR